MDPISARDGHLIRLHLVGRVDEIVERQIADIDTRAIAMFWAKAKLASASCHVARFGFGARRK
jgi:hypothetical protein